MWILTRPSDASLNEVNQGDNNMHFESIQYAVDNGIAILTLNRPDKLNSFTQAMHLEVRAALTALQEDKTVRVLVLT